MSWLKDRLAAGCRPYPVADLATALGIGAGDRRLTSKLALALGLNRGWVLRCRTLGLTERLADEWSTRAGIHPADVWPRWYDDLRGRALVNANKSRCPLDHPYDARDSRGRRICRTCKRDLARELRRKSTKVQAMAVATGTLDPCCEYPECTCPTAQEAI